MNGAFYIGAISLDAQQRALDIVANNVANMNTTGFKRTAVQFSELVSPMRDGSDFPVMQKQAAAGLAGVMLSASPRVWTQGNLQQTGQSGDLAISGDGFLQLNGPSGRQLLWRGGTLKVNDDGYLAAADGTPLSAMILVPQGATVAIAPDGTVTAQVSGQTNVQQLGQIDVAMVKSPETLIDDGNGYFETSDMSAVTLAKPGDEGAGTLVQGALEGSNTNLADEMTNLLLFQRSFGASAQVVQAGDQLMSLVNGLRR